MVPRWRFLATFVRLVFSASGVQQVSDLHLKIAPLEEGQLGPHLTQCDQGRGLPPYQVAS